MPTRRYERREPTHNWQQIRPVLKDPTQVQYEVIRPVILFGQTPKERAIETGIPRSTIYYRSNLFDQAGMPSLFPATPPPPVPEQKKLDQRTLRRQCVRLLSMLMLNTLRFRCVRSLPVTNPAMCSEHIEPCSPWSNVA